MSLEATQLTVSTLFAGRYEVIALLGEGGMGAVYHVRDQELDEAVALKLLRPAIAAEPGALDRFRREVKLARRVTHPNVARTYDLGVFEGVRYLTMELVDGEPLSHRLGPGQRLALPEALRVGAEVCRGLVAAHGVGVVHRDLKPDNIMMTADRVVITDFGIAHLAVAHDTIAKTIGEILGTPAYMAPEQLEGRELDGRADVYALGILLYEALTGKPPFLADSVFALAAARLTDTPRDPRSDDPSIPQAVATIVSAALARQREDRPDAQQLLHRLDVARGAPPETARRMPRLWTALSLSPAAAISGPLFVSVTSFRPATPDAASLAEDWSAAVADALVADDDLRVLGNLTERKAKADIVVEGSVRIAGSKVRAHARVFDAITGRQRWAGHFDGALDDPFAIEDALGHGVREAIVAHAREQKEPAGPRGSTERELYRRARVAYYQFTPDSVVEAIEILEDAATQFPEDPWIMSGLAAALLRAWTRGVRPAALARAEELALRALAVDGSIGETFCTIGILRFQRGEWAAAAHAFQDAIERSPGLAEAHEYLGRILAESGYAEAGARRLELAIRLDPKLFLARMERARVFALEGDIARSDAEVRELVKVANPTVAALTNGRFALWRGDRACAEGIVATLDFETASKFTLGALAPALGALARGERIEVTDEVTALLVNDGKGSDRSARQRCYQLQLAAELFAAAGEPERALDAITDAAELAMIDLLWLDECPMLACVREEARFGQARAVVSARIAEMWS